MSAVLPDSKRPRLEKFFFPGMAVLILITVFVGFARSYYLAGVFKAGPLPPLLHVHGASPPGFAGLLSGVSDGHPRSAKSTRPAATSEVCMISKRTRQENTFDMLIFSTLIYFAFRNRFNPAAHKWLVIIATIALLDAAFGRWPIDVVSKHFQFGCFALLMLLIDHDLWSTRKIHRATLWAGAFFVTLDPVRGPIGHTAGWQAFAAWVQNLARSSQVFDSHFFH